MSESDRRDFLKKLAVSTAYVAPVIKTLAAPDPAAGQVLSKKGGGMMGGGMGMMGGGMGMGMGGGFGMGAGGGMGMGTGGGFGMGVGGGMGMMAGLQAPTLPTAPWANE